MSDADAMLERMRNDAAIAELLAGWFEFDVERGDPVEPVRLASGAALDVVGGESAGGSYFLVGPGSQVQPVIYVSSEGQAGLIAADLTAALELIVALPYWADCLKFSAGGGLDEMRSAAGRLEPELLGYCPQIDSQRAQLRSELGVRSVPVDELLVRLCESVAGTEPDYVLIGPDGSEYESLFNMFRVSDNPAWRW